MSDNYTVRRYMDGDEAQIVFLLQRYFDQWADRKSEALDYWMWMYRDPRVESLIYVVEHEDEIVAADHWILKKVKIGEGYVNGIYTSDTIVHPDHRRRGLMTRMGELGRLDKEEREALFTYLFTDNEILIKQAKKVPTRCLFNQKIMHYIWVNDINLHIKMKSVENPLVAAIGLGVNKIAKNLLSRVNTDKTGTIEIVKIESFKDGNRFWDKIKNEYDIIIEKTPEYLDWRYCDLRSGCDIVFAGFENGDLAGYIALQIVEKVQDYPEGVISEILVADGRKDIASLLVSKSIEYFGERGVNVIRTFSHDGYFISSALTSNGFINTGNRAHVYFNWKGDEGVRNILSNCKGERFHISYGDLFLA